MRRVMICIQKEFEPFVSSWGAKCVPEKHVDGYLLPIGWDVELQAKGIEFEIVVIDVKEKKEVP